MALGGGSWLTQNKILPGSYINFNGVAQANATVSDRGVATMPFVSTWYLEDTVQTVTHAEFQRDSTMSIFGYAYGSDDIRMMNEVYAGGAHTCHWYGLNTGGAKASNDYGTAARFGSRGNDITIVIKLDPASTDTAYIVETWIMGASTESSDVRVDTQTVGSEADLVDTAWVVWDRENGLAIEEAGVPMTGGTEGTGRTIAAYQRYLDVMDSYSFNTMGLNWDDPAAKALFASYCDTMRETRGKKFQVCIFDYAEADNIGVISVTNKITDPGNETGEFGLVYWATGASAGCPINRSLTNTVYNGGYVVDVDYTQEELEAALLGGRWILHRVGEDIRVLDDVNTLQTVGMDMNDDFKNNQVIRVLDAIGNDIALLFNTKYLGEIPNDKGGRASLWGDIDSYAKQIEQIRAIEDWDSTQLTVEQGNTKKSVVVVMPIIPISVMTQLYMTVVVQ